MFSVCQSIIFEPKTLFYHQDDKWWASTFHEVINTELEKVIKLLKILHIELSSQYFDQDEHYTLRCLDEVEVFFQKLFLYQSHSPSDPSALAFTHQKKKETEYMKWN